ncbi:H-NS family nucleoid-associated regulatory protein [Burkholderia singularis]|uniref:H-NS histone family protein n=1 Tax=Burkholderia singularis TaxID=1503053 RepID=UPI0009EB696A|nr:H-NS histone family protein [Burkholderia singularis]
MTDYQQLIYQRKELQVQIDVAKREERRVAVATARDLIAEFDLHPQELFGRKYKPRNPINKVARYRDPETGATWSGFGRPPHWIAGRNREHFAIGQGQGA